MRTRRENAGKPFGFYGTHWMRAWGLTLLLFGVGMPSAAGAAVLAQDVGANYLAGWTDGSNRGEGFGPWEFIYDWGFHVAFQIGDPAEAEITGMPTNSFRLYGFGGYVHARRAFRRPLKVGDTFSLQWGNNWDTGGDYKGINLYSGGTQILNIHMGPSQAITLVPQDQPGQPMFSNYGTAAITLTFDYTAADTLRVHATGRDGVETFDEFFTISGAPDAFMVYAGDIQFEDFAKRIPYIDNLLIEGERVPELAFHVPEGVVAGTTHHPFISREGPTDDPLTVDLHSSDDGIAAFGGASVTIPAGETHAEVDLTGFRRGSATLTVSAAGFDSVEMELDVYDLAYDSASYYAPGTWTNESNGGEGFGLWELVNNDGDAGGGVTYSAGAFLGDSTMYGGGDVNVPDGTAFGLYAHSTDEGSPHSSATRLLSEFPEGGRLTFDLGVNYRNGSKGALLMRGINWLFEVAVRNDEYVFADWGAGDTGYTPLGWSYRADTAIRVIITRYPEDRYTVALDRTGALQNYMLIETRWRDLGGWAPDRVRFEVRETEADGANHFYFNRLGMNQYQVMEMEGVVNIDIGGSSTVHLRRSNTTGPLTVDLGSASPEVATVPETVEFADGEAVTTFSVTGVSESLVDIHAQAEGYICAPLMVNVFPFPEEWDDAGNYVPGRIVPTTFIDGSNGGGGFGPWEFDTPGTAIIDLESFIVPEVWFDSVHNHSFRILGGNQEFDFAEAVRPLLNPLAAGDQLFFVLGVNWSGGHRGVDIQDEAGQLLFNLNLSAGDTYTYTFGPNPGIDLGWGYDGNSAILLEVEQLINDQLRVTLTRSDGATASVFSDNLDAPAAKLVFYNGGHDGDPRQALFVNDLAIVRSSGERPAAREFLVTVVDIGGVDYLRATVNMGVGEFGVLYALEYTTDLAADPVVWIPADSAVGDGSTLLLLEDDNESDRVRIYRVRIVTPVG